MRRQLAGMAVIGLLAAAIPSVQAAERAGRSPAGPAAAEMPAIPPGARLPDCEAAEKGDPEAAFRLARRFLFGIGVPADRRLGTAWLRAAASRGHGEARKLVDYVPGHLGRIRPWCRPGAAPLRSVVLPPAGIVGLAEEIARQHGVEPALVLAVIQAESAFRSDAVSPKEAAGLMQLIPETAERFAVRDVFDPAENIRGGVRYLRWLLAYYRGDVSLALAAYNAGEGAVDRHKGIPPYEETRNYIRVIRRLYGAERHPFDPAIAAPSPLVARQAAELPRSGRG